MEEIKDLIKQEDYEKYKKLLQEFECKAIDIIEDLTYQFKETLAEDIDRKIKGWKDEYERLLKENWKKDDRIAELEQELTELKEKALFRRYKYNTICYYSRDNEYFRAKYLAPISQKYSLIQDTKTNEIYIEETDWLRTKKPKLKEMNGNE